MSSPLLDVDALLGDLAREIAPQAADRGLALSVQRCGRELDCDPVLVARMLRNLIDNALRHTSQGGVTLAGGTCAVPGDPARSLMWLSVTDTGSGIATEHQAWIFDEHYQAGNESRQRAQGLGLGLAIVRRIAALHDVAVDVESAPARGSRFTLRFRSSAHRPLRDALPAAPPATTGVQTPRFAGRRLLLIEDDEALGNAFLAWLRATGFEARRAVDGAQALRMLDCAGPLDAVLSDFRLPGPLDGLALLERARERHPGACLVLVSGDINPGLAERATANGVPLLSKPVDPTLLYTVLALAVKGGLQSDC
ncbi:MAG: ATP-binding protein [Gammaproteobacteria bacterium]